jgi:hypothetical protein
MFGPIEFLRNQLLEIGRPPDEAIFSLVSKN